MTSLKFLLVAGISAVAFSSAAAAQDLVLSDPSAYGASNFDGGFVGVFGGGALSAVDLDTALLPEGILELRPDGWLLGVDAGFNFSLGNGLVLGVVGDLAWTDQTDTFGAIGAEGLTSTIDWLGSIRARAGFDAGNFMPYLTAGLGFAHNTLDLAVADDNEPPELTTISDDQTHMGWTLGAGVEFAATDSLTIDVGYRYSDYGTATYSTPLPIDGEGGATEVDFGLTSHQLTVGLHYGF